MSSLAICCFANELINNNSSTKSIPEKMDSLLSILCSSASFKKVFACLRIRADKEKRIIFRAPYDKNLSLGWILEHEELVTSKLLKDLRRKTYYPQEPLPNVIIDGLKERTLLSLSWPDRIIDSILSDAIRKIIEPKLSSQLFSYKQGKNNYMAVKEAASFFKRAYNDKCSLYVLRRDVSKYSAHIHRDTLLELYKGFLGEHDEYLWKLLTVFLSLGKQIRDNNEGIPMGLSLTPCCENIYLSTLDKALSEIPESLYLRYGDDILFATPNFEYATSADIQLQVSIEQLRLTFNLQKKQNLIFSCGSITKDKVYKSSNALEYLGFSIDKKGEVFLSKKKENTLKTQIRRTMKISYHLGRRFYKTEKDLVAHLIKTHNREIMHKTSHPYMKLLLSNATSFNSIKKFDYWLAKQILSQFYGTSHDRVFQRMSLRQLSIVGRYSLSDFYNKRCRIPSYCSSTLNFSSKL